LELENLLQQATLFLNQKAQTETLPAPETSTSTDANPPSSQAESGSSQTSVAVVAEQPAVRPQDTLESRCNQFITSIIARSVHGSSKTLSQLVESVKKILDDFHSQLSAYQPAMESAENNQLVIAQKDSLLSELTRAANVQTLGEDIKSVAKRDSLGHRLKNIHAFEDDSLAAMWRWETFSPQHFTTVASSSTLKEAKTIRGRYSRVVKALSKVIEQVSKLPYDESKVAPLEEKVSKAVAEVEKAKEKRRELEVKKEKDAQDKVAKEALKEQKRKEKEEADAIKKQQQDAIAKAKADQQAEKEKKANEEKEKKAELLRKQQNALRGFINVNASSNTKVTSSSGCSVSFSLPANVSHSSSVAASSSSVNASNDVEIVNVAVDDDAHYKSFLEQVNKGMTMAEVLADHRKQRQLRNASCAQQKKSTPKKSRTIRISVLASAKSPKQSSNNHKNTFNAFAEDDEQDYIEMREKVVANKIKTLYFHEDYRPAYVGTFSKTSTVISGRNPFGKDSEVFNYEYDSEEEWEEEEEGEDIMESGDEEDEEDEANELEYDDMFRRDDDFGSDVDEDGEDLQVMTVSALNRGVRYEVVGPRFVRNVQVNDLTNAIDHSMNVTKYNPDQIITIGDKSKARGVKHSNSNCNEFATCHMTEDDEMFKVTTFPVVVFAPSFLTLSMNNKSSSNGEKEKSSKSSSNKEKSSSSATSPQKKKEKNPVVVEANSNGENTTSEVVNKEKMMKGFDESKVSLMHVCL
jgi:hypothetical protein